MKIMFINLYFLTIFLEFTINLYYVIQFVLLEFSGKCMVGLNLCLPGLASGGGVV